MLWCHFDINDYIQVRILIKITTRQVGEYDGGITRHTGQEFMSFPQIPFRATNTNRTVIVSFGTSQAELLLAMTSMSIMSVQRWYLYIIKF
jgi:hypothetical protein